MSELFTYFASPQPDSAIVESLARSFRESHFELRPLLKTILLSRAFYAESCIGSQIKSPVQLVAGTIHLLGLPVPPTQMLFGALQLMGQAPMMPPNVRGWPGGRNWINASTLFMRYNAAVRLAAGRLNMNGLAAGQPAEVVDHLVDRLIGRPIDPRRRQVLLDGCRSRAKPEQAIREVCQLIVSMPEYQLC